MDSTPPSDLPDPTSPTPATDQPVGSTPGGAVPKPGEGRIRSMPPPVTRASRLPGTYAANFSGDDMNWRRGAGVLWTLFALTAGIELLRTSCILLIGFTGWPYGGDMIRIGMSAAVFVSLWLGWRWTRWVLVVTDFWSGMYLFVWGIAGHLAGQSAPTTEGLTRISPLISTLPTVALGSLYLCIAAYLAFSADVVEFTRHRREEGRGWVAAPVAVLALAYVAVLFTLEVPYAIWNEVRVNRARAFGASIVRRMSQRWDPQSVDGLGDVRFDAQWTPAFKKAAFESLAPLGALETSDQADIVSLPTVFELGKGGFIMHYEYSLRQARFAHGTADIGVTVVKPLFGPWEIDDLQMNDVHFDPKPPHAPVPVPGSAPGAGVMPAPTAETEPAPTVSPANGG